MENIKFSGKSMWDKSKIFGLLTYVYGSTAKIKMQQGGFEISVYSESVAQFTCLLDKNLTEIYNGDKFTDNSGKIFTVEFQKGAFGYIVHDELDKSDKGRFVSFAENFANLKGKGNVLQAVEIVND